MHIQVNESVRELCNFLGSVLSQQKFEAMDQCYSSMLKLNFIQKIEENTSSRFEGMPRERDHQPFGSSFYVFFSPPTPPPGLLYLNWTSRECCLFYLRSSLWSSDLPLFFFCGIVPSLSFSHHHSGLLFPILTT